MRALGRLYVQMLLGILAGTAIGYAAPAFGRDLGPLGIAFVKAMRMMVPPVLFCTIVEGIVRHGAARDTGTTVLRSLIIFLGITVAALGIGLAVTLAMQPGKGLPLPAYGDAAAEVQRQLAGRQAGAPAPPRGGAGPGR